MTLPSLKEMPLKNAYAPHIEGGQNASKGTCEMSQGFSDTAVANTDGEARFSLAESVTHDAVADLAKFVFENADRSIVLDGSNVRQIGAQGAQLLSMATMAWAELGTTVTISDPKGAVANCLKLLGMNDFLQYQEMGEFKT